MDRIDVADDGSGFPQPAARFGGLGLGLAVAGIVYLKDRHSDSPAVQSAKAGKKKSHGEQRGAEIPDAEAAYSGAPEEPAKSYDFYSMLPKFEVVVPEKDKDVKPDIRGVPETRRAPAPWRRSWPADALAPDP